MMQIKGTEGFAPIQTSAARRSSGTARTAAQDGYYDHFTVSSPGAQDRNSFREMVASLSYQVRRQLLQGGAQVIQHLQVLPP